MCNLRNERLEWIARDQSARTVDHSTRRLLFSVAALPRPTVRGLGTSHTQHGLTAPQMYETDIFLYGSIAWLYVYVLSVRGGRDAIPVDYLNKC